MVAMHFGYAYARGQPGWSLRATWCAWTQSVFFSTYDLVWSKIRKS